MEINNKLRLIASYIGPRLLTYSLGIDSGQLEEYYQTNRVKQLASLQKELKK